MLDKPILITGCARSGTSMTAGIIRISGAFGGDTSGPNPYNPKGMFENALIRDRIVKPFLISVGFDPMGQNPLPDPQKLPNIPAWKNNIVRILQEQGYFNHNCPWFYKGAKMCLMYTVWHDAFPNAKWIIVRRPTKDIINSCLNTRFMRAYNNVEGWNSWVNHHLDCFEKMREDGLNIKEVWTDRIVGGDFSEIKKVCYSYDLGWNEEIVREFVARDLWHGSVV